jgi:hypothetical protein
LLAFCSLALTAGSSAACNGSDCRAGPAAGGAGDDVPLPPPHVKIRGEAQVEPLALTLSGLASGHARVGAGPRIFGVCWRGGTGPYEVTLRDAGGAVLGDWKDLGPDASELIKSSKPPIDFKPGRYQVEVGDHAGARAVGRFQAVEAAKLPSAGDGASAVAAARTLAQGGSRLAYSYEAYLRTLPLARGAPASDAAGLVKELCHRPAQ